VGSLFTTISIQDAQKPFFAKFHRLGMKSNRQHSSAMVAALTGQPSAALAPATELRVRPPLPGAAAPFAVRPGTA
jgi:hypothetical protein